MQEQVEIRGCGTFLRTVHEPPDGGATIVDWRIVPPALLPPQRRPFHRTVKQIAATAASFLGGFSAGWMWNAWL